MGCVIGNTVDSLEKKKVLNLICYVAESFRLQFTVFQFYLVNCIVQVWLKRYQFDVCVLNSKKKNFLLRILFIKSVKSTPELRQSVIATLVFLTLFNDYPINYSINIIYLQIITLILLSNIMKFCILIYTLLIFRED